MPRLALIVALVIVAALVATSVLKKVLIVAVLGLGIFWAVKGLQRKKRKQLT